LLAVALDEFHIRVTAQTFEITLVDFPGEDTKHIDLSKVGPL
jgi:hypothetical protein